MSTIIGMLVLLVGMCWLHFFNSPKDQHSYNTNYVSADSLFPAKLVEDNQFRNDPDKYAVGNQKKIPSAKNIDDEVILRSWESGIQSIPQQGHKIPLIKVQAPKSISVLAIQAEKRPPKTESISASAGNDLISTNLKEGIQYEDGKPWEGEGYSTLSRNLTPLGWERKGCCLDQIEMYRDLSIYHNGKSSALIHAPTQGFKGNGRWSQTFSGKAFAGNRIRLKMYALVQHLEKEAGIKLLATNKKESKLFKRKIALVDPDLKGEWQEVSIELDMPKKVRKIEISAFLEGHGKIWVDDFRIEVVGKKGPVAAEKLNRKGGNKEMPLNLGFERDD